MSEGQTRGEVAAISIGRFVRFLFLSLLLELVVLHWVILAFDLPYLNGTFGWFWNRRSPPLDWAWLLLPVAAVTFGVAFVTLRFPKRVALNLTLLVALGYLLQHGFARMEGQGLHAMRNRALNTGHSELILDAIERPDLLSTLRDYDALVLSDELGPLCWTKPPGQLGFYIVNERISRMGDFAQTAGGRLDSFATHAAWVWPLLASLTAVPLFFLSRRVLGDESAYAPALLYLVCPNVVLINLHLDQVLFPLLLTTTLWLWLMALESRRIGLGLGLGALAGALAFVGAYISFAMLTALPLVALLGLSPLARGGPPRRPLFPHLHAALDFVIGWSVLHTCAAVFLNFSIIAQFSRAIEYHATWRWPIRNWHERIHWGLLHLLEFSLWSGIIVAGLALVGLGAALHALRHRRLDLAGLLTLSFAVVVLQVSFYSGSRGEVGRLFLLLVPPLCIAAVAGMRCWPVHQRNALLLLAVAVQLATTFVTKRFQDFF